MQPHGQAPRKGRAASRKAVSSPRVAVAEAPAALLAPAIAPPAQADEPARARHRSSCRPRRWLVARGPREDEALATARAAAVAQSARDVHRQGVSSRIVRRVNGRSARPPSRIWPDRPRHSGASPPAAGGCWRDSRPAAPARHCRRRGSPARRRCRTVPAYTPRRPGCCRADRTDRRQADGGPAVPHKCRA